MKRRDLIKSSLLVAGAIGVGLTGCTNENKKGNKTSDGDIINPKPTGTYKICTPLPLDFGLIDEIKNLNTKFKKSQITTLYNSFPAPLAHTFKGDFQTIRGWNEDIKSYNDFGQYVKYAQDLGFHFVYCLNSPKPFDEITFKDKQKTLWELLDNLEKTGVNELRIANQQLMQIINKERPNFKISVSTSTEFHNISQYKIILQTIKNIRSINISIDDSRNFTLLKNLKASYPDIELEIMLNEPCFHGCPSRISHPCSIFAIFDCIEYGKNLGSIKSFFSSNMIYPWQLAYYSHFNINSFKLFFKNRGGMKSLDFLSNYLNCVENGIEDLSASNFFYNVMELKYGSTNINPEVKLKDIIQYFPDINHFIKYGDKCGSICGTECHYCMNCAEQIEKLIS